MSNVSSPRRFDENLYYQYCRTNNIPYFGSVMHALQGVPIRHAYMQLVVKQECDRKNGEPFRILEIGSWAGGSAITWADAIKRFNQGNGLVLCIDPWLPYFNRSESLRNLPENSQSVYKEMDAALVNQEIYQLYEHNINSSNHSDIITTFKGYSDAILPLLKEQYFDLIFIDGNHFYEYVLEDIKSSVSILKDGGIICGDDLELQIDEIDIENARSNLESDYILDSKNNLYFHPGVSLAVGDFFKKRVSTWEGFWSMRKSNNSWSEVDLGNIQEPQIPLHFIQEELERSKYKLEIAESEVERLRLKYPEPVLLESFDTYNIVGWKNNYIGLSKELGEINLGTFIIEESNNTHSVFVELSIDRLKDEILSYLEFQQTQTQLQQTQTQLQQTQTQLQQTQTQLQQTQTQIEAMKSSKFWKLRQAWFKVKKRLGLPVEGN